MKLPNATQAIVPVEKLVAYLLDPGHPDNGGKANFFFRFGFKTEEPGPFAQALLNHAVNTEVAHISMGFDGISRYILEGPLVTPLGRSPKVRSIWVIERSQTLPRLVTAYPAK
jgi:hypothetical protein